MKTLLPALVAVLMMLVLPGCNESDDNVKAICPTGYEYATPLSYGIASVDRPYVISLGAYSVAAYYLRDYCDWNLQELPIEGSDINAWNPRENTFFRFHHATHKLVRIMLVEYWGGTLVNDVSVLEYPVDDVYTPQLIELGKTIDQLDLSYYHFVEGNDDYAVYRYEYGGVSVVVLYFENGRLSSIIIYDWEYYWGYI
jgi:hypothetical protein